MDMKEYDAGEQKFPVSQVEVNFPNEMLKRKMQLLPHLLKLMERHA